MGVVAAAGVAGPSMTALAAQEGDAQGSGNEEQLFSCMCRSNCMGSCRYYAHVRDGKLMKLTPAEYPVEGYRGSCLKGLAYIERIYSPTRVKYPMRRVGERGAGSVGADKLGRSHPRDCLQVHGNQREIRSEGRRL